MTAIADFLKVSVEQIRLSTFPQYRICSSCFISVNILQSYLNRFPLIAYRLYGLVYYS